MEIRLKKSIKKNTPLNIISMRKDGDNLLITAEKDKNLSAGTTLFIKKKVLDGFSDNGRTLSALLKIKSLEESGEYMNFVVPFPYRERISIEDVIFPKEGNRFTITFSGKTNITSYDIAKYDGVETEESSENLYLEAYDLNGETYSSNGLYTFDMYEKNVEAGVEEKDGNLVNDAYSIFCNNFDTDITPGIMARFSGSDFMYSTDGINYKLFENGISSLYYTTDFITIPVGLSSKSIGGLNSEDLLSRRYAENTIDEMIPDFIDMEKSLFEPYYFDGGKYKPVEKIVINPFFRKKNKDKGWITNDSSYWEQSDENGNFPEGELVGDSLHSMGFSLSDVVYRKKKAAKSFFRISFYENDDAVSNMLLFYSTVFLGLNVPYRKIIENGEFYFDEKVSETEKNNAFETDARCQCVVKDFFNGDSSSEGFYVYLFSDIVNNGEKDIYMKVEFNHAGYGKTVPLTLPKDADGNAINRPKKSYIVVSEDGSLNIDTTKLFKDRSIPIVVKEINADGTDITENDVVKQKKKIYVFPDELVDKENGTVTLNLFEPKAN